MAFHGLEISLRTLPGARALRVVHPAWQAIHEHQHDWPCLTLYALGSYTEAYEGEEISINGPAAVLHPAGGAHANRIHHAGLETISIQFDPSWLRGVGYELRLERAHSWSGGPVAIAARSLSSEWRNPTSTEAALRCSIGRFVRFALNNLKVSQPSWLGHVVQALDIDAPVATQDIARKLDLHPAWLARAYRLATGEGMHETLRRKRVERAAGILREECCPLAQVAAAAGFCDQSHMNRAFRNLVGRTPLEVRSEQRLLTSLKPISRFSNQTEDFSEVSITVCNLPPSNGIFGRA